MKTYKQISYDIFGKIADPYIKKFNNLKSDLYKSGLSYSLDEYVSVIIFTCFLVFMISLFVSIAILLLYIKISFPILFSIFISLVSSLVCFSIFIWYPSLIKKSRSNKIDVSLPFITSYMRTIAGSGVTPQAIFENTERFSTNKELLKEITKINRDIKLFGTNFITVLKSAAYRSPSETWKNFLLEFASNTESGADIENFIKISSDKFMKNYVNMLEKYSEIVSLICEVYLTVVVAGSIFIIVLTVVFGAMGGGGNTLMIHFMMPFVVIPSISIIFIILLKKLYPGV